MKILKTFLLSFALLLVFGVVAAQETDIAEIVALDESVTAEDLNIEKPKLLPDSPFYFFKNWGREIQSVFTFNPIKKAELREKFANEKLIELKKMVEENKSAAVVQRAIDNYQKEVEKIKVVTDRIKEKAKDSPEVEKFLDRYVKHQILHGQLLDKLETQVPTTAFEKIKEAREIHIEKFGEVMTKLEDRKEKIGERLEKSMVEIKGSEFKDFKNLEVLKKLEEKVPEAAKEAIQQVRANTLIRLKEKVEAMPIEKMEQFQAYTENISGAKEKQVEILDNLREELKAQPIIRQKLIETRGNIMEKIRIKAEKTLPVESIKPTTESTEEEVEKEEGSEKTQNILQKNIIELKNRLQQLRQEAAIER